MPPVASRPTDVTRHRQKPATTRKMKKDQTQKEQITAIGIVIPVEWDEKGRPSAHAIASYDEEEYLIDIRTETGKQLSGVDRQKIRATGTLGSRIKNRRLISITSYEVLFSSPNPKDLDLKDLGPKNHHS